MISVCPGDTRNLSHTTANKSSVANTRSGSIKPNTGNVNSLAASGWHVAIGIVASAGRDQMFRAPTQTFQRGKKLLFARRKHGFARDGHQITLSLNAVIQPFLVHAPDACAFLAVGNRGDQMPVHCPVVIRAQRYSVGWLVIPADVKRNQMRCLDERHGLIQQHAHPAGRTTVIVNLQDRPAECPITTRRHFLAQHLLCIRWGEGVEGALRPRQPLFPILA